MPEGTKLYTTPQPCHPASVFVAGNRVSTVIFASRKDADAYVASVPTSAGVVVSEVPLVGTTAPCPECSEKQSAIDVWEGRYADKAAECEKLKAERDELAAQVEKMREVLEDVQKCEFAARVEGLVECLAAIDDEHSPAGRLKDLVERRLLYMARYADEALALPDLSTSILNRVRADALQNAMTHLKTRVCYGYSIKYLTEKSDELRTLDANMEKRQ